VKWFRLAAVQGYVNAQTNLVDAHAKGQGVSKVYAEAVKWFHKAADQGFAPAQILLAAMYING
jgi:uncharacterized protein